MYNKQKIFEQAKEAIPTMGINESLHNTETTAFLLNSEL